MKTTCRNCKYWIACDEDIDDYHGYCTYSDDKKPKYDYISKKEIPYPYYCLDIKLFYEYDFGKCLYYKPSFWYKLKTVFKKY